MCRKTRYCVGSLNFLRVLCGDVPAELGEKVQRQTDLAPAQSGLAEVHVGKSSPRSSAKLAGRWEPGRLVADRSVPAGFAFQVQLGFPRQRGHGIEYRLPAPKIRQRTGSPAKLGDLVNRGKKGKEITEQSSPADYFTLICPSGNREASSRGPRVFPRLRRKYRKRTF